ncbi:hypothetical protein GH714_042892 [Hevea brasiliensis]|uniref:Uncharacterized protein n=1 Tax=Hevea brasiliensis TaxID=3981 RepID=A0A6A6K1N8_HEVBR|nr:hypothetical protein GH714_042892 [Hevea brasiliensis]
MFVGYATAQFTSEQGKQENGTQSGAKFLGVIADSALREMERSCVDVEDREGKSKVCWYNTTENVGANVLCISGTGSDVSEYEIRSRDDMGVARTWLRKQQKVLRRYVLVDDGGNVRRVVCDDKYSIVPGSLSQDILDSMVVQNGQYIFPKEFLERSIVKGSDDPCSDPNSKIVYYHESGGFTSDPGAISGCSHPVTQYYGSDNFPRHWYEPRYIFPSTSGDFKKYAPDTNKDYSYVPNELSPTVTRNYVMLKFKAKDQRLRKGCDFYRIEAWGGGEAAAKTETGERRSGRPGQYSMVVLRNPNCTDEGCEAFSQNKGSKRVQDLELSIEVEVGEGGRSGTNKKSPATEPNDDLGVGSDTVVKFCVCNNGTCTQNPPGSGKKCYEIMRAVGGGSKHAGKLDASAIKDLVVSYRTITGDVLAGDDGATKLLLEGRAMFTKFPLEMNFPLYDQVGKMKEWLNLGIAEHFQGRSLPRELCTWKDRYYTYRDPGDFFVPGMGDAGKITVKCREPPPEIKAQQPVATQPVTPTSPARPAASAKPVATKPAPVRPPAVPASKPAGKCGNLPQCQDAGGGKIRVTYKYCPWWARFMVSQWEDRWRLVFATAAIALLLSGVPCIIKATDDDSTAQEESTDDAHAFDNIPVDTCRLGSQGVALAEEVSNTSSSTPLLTARLKVCGAWPACGTCARMYEGDCRYVFPTFVMAYGVKDPTGPGKICACKVLACNLPWDPGGWNRGCIQELGCFDKPLLRDAGPFCNVLPGRKRSARVRFVPLEFSKQSFWRPGFVAIVESWEQDTKDHRVLHRKVRKHIINPGRSGVFEGIIGRKKDEYVWHTKGWKDDKEEQQWAISEQEKSYSFSDAGTKHYLKVRREQDAVCVRYYGTDPDMSIELFEECLPIPSMELPRIYQTYSLTNSVGQGYNRDEYVRQHCKNSAASRTEYLTSSDESEKYRIKFIRGKDTVSRNGDNTRQGESGRAFVQHLKKSTRGKWMVFDEKGEAWEIQEEQIVENVEKSSEWYKKHITDNSDRRTRSSESDTCERELRECVKFGGKNMCECC